MDHLPSLQDDGLVTPEVGSWAEDKYQLVRCYATIFSNAMSAKWASLAYVDLFAGAGRARIRDITRIVPASPLAVLDISRPFGKYIFAELDADKISALRQRVSGSFPNRDVTYIQGDCNERVQEILAAIPTAGVLTFCFVDPYGLSSLRFKTIERLAENRKVDFLVLIPTGMDAHRNEALYSREDNEVIATFAGAADWRVRRPESQLKFGDFVADEFGRSMARLGYRFEGIGEMKHIRSSEKNLSLYRLGFFSKHPLGAKFWDECRKYTDSQRRLF